MTGANPFLRLNMKPEMDLLKKASSARRACKAAERKEV
jgi:hypothetical protein